MKAIVIYCSKTGFTKRYAQWIAAELGCEAVPYARRNDVKLVEYDTIVYGGGLKAGMIGGVKWLKTQLSALAGKRVAVFATGAMPAQAAEVQKSLRQNFSDSEWRIVRAFYLPGGLNYEKMCFADKSMMKIFCAMLKKKQPDDPALEWMTQSYDQTNKAEIEPLVAYCKA